MTPEQFVYWLNGFFELGKPVGLSAQQVESIKDHLALVMKKVTPHVTIPAYLAHLQPAGSLDYPATITVTDRPLRPLIC